MNKNDLILAISEKSGISVKKAKKVVNSITASIQETLSKSEDVKISDFGSFQVVTKKERKGRNPQTNEEILIPSSKSPVFKAAQFLKDKVNDRDFIMKLLTVKKIDAEEAETLKYVAIKSKELKESNNNNDDLFMIEVEDIAKHFKVPVEEVKKSVEKLINKKVLNTMVYYGDVDSVYLRADYRKYL